MPLDGPEQDSGSCPRCSDGGRVLDRVRAATLYDDGIRPLILAFKHADRTDMARALAPWMARVAPDLLRDADLVVPVPLHRWRLLWRRYNQSALLARGLLARAGPQVLYSPVLLQRVRSTVAQGHLNRARRYDNVAGAFRVASQHRARVAGRRVLLVDDVMTSGATLHACALALRSAGSGPVDAVVLARAVPSGL